MSARTGESTPGSPRLQGRVALVTGGGSGFGRAIALRLAGEGAVVAVTGRRADPLAATVDAIRKDGGEGLAVPGDATVGADVRRVVGETIGQLGGLDVLVNNAGAIVARATVSTCREEDFRRAFEANALSVFFYCKEAMPELIRRRGSVINIASMGGLKAAPNHLPYSVAKAAVIHMTKCMALDHAADGVRINCICPAYIETDMNREHLRRLRESGGYETLVAGHPLGLQGTPEDVAAAVIYLACDGARWNTGAIVPVGGGVTATI